MKRICLILALCMIFSLLGGCGDSGTPRESTEAATESTGTTAPPETLPPETTSPTTLPPETVPGDPEESVTMPPLDYHKEHIEEKFGVETYDGPGYFLLKNPGLEIGFQDGSPVTLKLPESWAGKYYVIELIYGLGSEEYATEQIWDICIVSKDVLQTYWKVFDTRCFDYSLVLWRILRQGDELSEEQQQMLVAQDEEYYYFVGTYETLGGDNFWAAKRNLLLSEISDEDFLKAQGDITCTLEEAIAMCSVNPEE